MANETTSKQSGSNLTPVIIIGGILLATIFGIYMISQSGVDEKDDKAAKSKDSKSVTKGSIPNYNTASPGANPANFKGSANATIVVEEFADFQCGTCKTVHPRINEIISTYGSKIKIIFRHYPITQIHPNAYKAAVASEAAGIQGKFWEMQNLIFNNQSNWSNFPSPDKEFEKYAKTIGIDVERFSNDLLGLPAKSRVDADMKRGRELNIQATPTILINGKKSPITLEGMKKMIDAELERMNPKKEDTQSKPSEESSDKKDEEKKDEEKKDK